MEDKPIKSILRTQPAESYERKSTKFDELNILQTLNKHGERYSYIPIDEEKTPFVIPLPRGGNEMLDSDMLKMKLRLAQNTQTPSFGDDDLSDEEFPETDEEKVARIVFQRRRKAHYNEFSAVQLARELIKRDLERIEQMIDEDSTTIRTTSMSQSDISTDFNVETEVETQYSVYRSSGTTSSATLNEGDIMPPKSKEIEDLLEPTHPCYNRIRKQQQLRQDEQLREESEVKSHDND